MRQRWMPGIEITERTCKRDKSTRWLWPDGTAVQAYFTAKGEAKSSVAVQHTKLTDRQAAEQAKKDWGDRLAALATILQS